MTESKTKAVLSAPQLWGGVECTINRVGDVWFDQTHRNGHRDRLNDFNLFAETGFNQLRHGILWESVQGSNADGVYDFTRADAQMSRIRELKLGPIVGLLHHGSGPSTTSLVDPEFPEKFALYARAVAERYPWVRDYTPINEILTTARFSALYGVWYPHARDHRSFFAALLNQVRGTVLAMREIRKVNPDARLIQTDDLGRAQGTLPCREQTDFENERRWLSFDLLMGRVDQSHALWGWMVAEGAPVETLRWLQQNFCAPDIIGVNHYLLSNRWLDHRSQLFPDGYRGGNGRIAYADIGAVQTRDFSFPEPRPKSIGPEEILRDVAARYALPIAITEVHVDGPRESQLQWFNEVWTAACRLKAEGLPIVAVTAWSLLGSFDWNSLCTRDGGYYETGVHDVRAANPRPTAIASLLRELSSTGKSQHPVLADAGWWRASKKESRRHPLILITGATGTLGRAFARICEERGLSYKIVSRKDMDIADMQSVRQALNTVKPWVVINAAGYVRVEQAELQESLAYRENVIGPEVLASECRALGIPLLTFSSDLVFGAELSGQGTNQQSNQNRLLPYLELDTLAPNGVYGRSKAEMEPRVLAANPESLIVRTSSFFGPWDHQNFIWKTLRELSKGADVSAASNGIVSPTYVPQLVNVCLDLVLDGLRDIVHLTSAGQVSWATFGKMAARQFDFSDSQIRDAELARAKFSALGTSRVPGVMPSLEAALDRYKWDLDPELLSVLKKNSTRALSATEAS